MPEIDTSSRPFTNARWVYATGLCFALFFAWVAGEAAATASAADENRDPSSHSRIDYNGPDPRKSLPKTWAKLLEGQKNGQHIGAQLFVVHQGKPVADFAFGTNREGVSARVPMTRDTMMIWYSATKPVSAACVLQLVERGKLKLDDPVAKHIPEFAKHGKERVTVRHVLTHTSCFARAVRAGTGFLKQNHEHVKDICESKLQEGWTVGKTAQYHPLSGWFILGELVERVDGRPFEQYVREEIFLPLGMKDSWVGMSAEQSRAYGDRIGVMHNTNRGKPVPAPKFEKLELMNQIVSPGAAGRGPMRELARFYQMLGGWGKLDGRRVLKPETVRLMTRNHRHDAVTPSGRPAAPWGLGISLGFAQALGVADTSRSFGHGGSQSSFGFCDLDNDLQGAMVFNGRPGGAQNRKRRDAILGSIYEDLGIVK